MRIISVVPITVLAWYDLRWWVFGTYIAAALTDLFDGMFARRATPAATETDLDGLADLLFSAVTLLWLWLLIPNFFQTYWLPYIPLLVLLEMYMIPIRIRHNRMRIPHFQFGRFAMALFFFLLPVLLLWGDVSWFVHLVFSVGVLAKLQLAWAMMRLRSIAAKNAA